MSLSLASLMSGYTQLGRLTVGICHSNRLRIYVGRQALAICEVSGRFRPKIQAKAILPIPTPDGVGTDDILTVALNALSGWLQTKSRRMEIDWIIGIDHVRYLVLPWDERLSSKSFCEVLAAALFAQQFSDSIQPFSAYQLRFAPLSFGQPRLVALIPSGTVRALTAFALRHKCRNRCISPALGVVWDQCVERTKETVGIFALVEGARLLRIGYERGHVVSLSVQPFSSERMQAIERTANFVFPAYGQFSLEHLAPDDDARLAYALCGALET